MRIKNGEMTAYSDALTMFMYNQVGLSRNEVGEFYDMINDLEFFQSEYKSLHPDMIDDAHIRATPTWKWADEKERKTYEYFVQEVNEYLHKYLMYIKNKVELSHYDDQSENGYNNSHSEFTVGADGGSYF